MIDANVETWYWLLLVFLAIRLITVLCLCSVAVASEKSWNYFVAWQPVWFHGRRTLHWSVCIFSFIFRSFSVWPAISFFSLRNALCYREYHDCSVFIDLHILIFTFIWQTGSTLSPDLWRDRVTYELIIIILLIIIIVSLRLRCRRLRRRDVTGTPHRTQGSDWLRAAN